MMMNSRALLICAVLLIVCIASSYATAASDVIGSKWTSPQGNRYDFSRGKKQTSPDTDGFVYSFSWANTYSDSTGCKGTGCLMRSGSFEATTAFWESGKGPYVIQEHNPGNLTIFFDNGINSSGRPFQFTVTARCGADSTFPDSGISMTINSRAACPLDDDGLSGGAIFLIIIFSLWAAYFIIGFLVCKFYFKRTTIAHSIPHLAFWASLPGFYIAGCKVAIGFVQSKISGAKNNAGTVDSDYGSTEEV